MFSQLRFGVFAGVLAFLGAGLLWPPDPHYVVPGTGGISRLLVQVEAAICGTIAAMFVGHQFARSKAPRWSFAIAGLIALYLTLILLAQAVAWSNQFIPREPPPQPLMVSLTFALGWCHMFTVGVIRDPIVALLDLAAIVGAVMLIRRPDPGTLTARSNGREETGAGGRER